MAKIKPAPVPSAVPVGNIMPGAPTAAPAAEANGKPAKNKTVCPVGRADFMAKAPPLEVVIDGRKFVAGPREFSTRSLGYNVSDKFTALVDGKVVTYQIGLNITAVGSKELP
jgi:hypothetical protein